jgi:DNA-binding MurR/RpiR family transcriptional regulator
MRYRKIKNQIQQAYYDLPKNQKRVADFFIENFDEIPFQSVQVVSKSSSTSVATVVRFAQRIGFSGFSEIRDQIAQNLQKQIRDKEIFPLIKDSKVNQDTLTVVANQDIKNINETLILIEKPAFKQAMDLILAAGNIYTIGLGISNLLAQILAYQFNQIGFAAFPFRHDSLYFSEQIILLKPKDLIIAFSFPPYSKETIESAKYAKEKGINLVAITNKNSSPITHYSTVNLLVKSENMLFTNSFAAISVLINAISTECVLRDKKRVLRMLKKLEGVPHNQNLLV